MGSIWQIFNKNMAENENKEWKQLENSLKNILQNKKNVLSLKSDYMSNYGNILSVLNNVIIACKETFEKVMMRREKNATNGDVCKLNNILKTCSLPLTASDCENVLSVLGAPKLINFSGWNNDLRKLCKAYYKIAEKLAGLTVKSEDETLKKYKEWCTKLGLDKAKITSDNKSLMERYVDWLLIAYKKSNKYEYSKELIETDQTLNKNIGWLTNCILAQSVVALIHLVKNCKCSVDNVLHDLQKRTGEFTYGLITAKKGGITPVDALKQENEKLALPYLMWIDKLKLFFSQMENLPNKMPADAALVCLLFENRKQLENVIKELVVKRHEALNIRNIAENKLNELFRKTCLGRKD